MKRSFLSSIKNRRLREGSTLDQPDLLHKLMLGEVLKIDISGPRLAHPEAAIAETSDPSCSENTSCADPPETLNFMKWKTFTIRKLPARRDGLRERHEAILATYAIMSLTMNAQGIGFSMPGFLTQSK